MQLYTYVMQMNSRFKVKIRRTKEFPGVWHRGKQIVPNDPRDVLALVVKPVWDDRKKKMVDMQILDVIHHEKKSWWLNGKALNITRVVTWCEIPDGWQK